MPQRTSAYVEQTDLHLPELTVRETMDFAARVQGVGHRPGRLFAPLSQTSLPTCHFFFCASDFIPLDCWSGYRAAS